MGKHKNIAAFTGLFAAIISTIALSTSVYATTNTESGLFTDSNDVRWEYLRETDTENVDEPESVSIMFYDKPESMSQIIVPSLEEVLSKVPNATSTLDTYYIKNATGELYGETKRESTADITKVDFTNTSKVQILGIQPMVNKDVETEIIFGDNIVIGDAVLEYTAKITDHDVRGDYYSYSDFYSYKYNTERTLHDWEFESVISGWNSMAKNEKMATINQLDYYETSETFCHAPVYANESDRENNTYYYNGHDRNIESCMIEITYEIKDGAFEGYKLKVSGLDKVKYIGWSAFKNVTFNSANQEITLGITVGSEPQTYGDAVFAGSNIKKATILNNNMGTAMFMDDENLTEVIIADEVTKINPQMFTNTDLTSLPNIKNVEEIGYQAFKNTTMGDVDFSNTAVKIIDAEAFMDANVTALNLGDKIEKIASWAFANNSIPELYLPKSLNDLHGGYVFHNNPTEKITIAFDTQSTATRGVSFGGYMDGGDASSGCFWSNANTITICNVKELTLVAPYTEDEEPSENHVSTREYGSYPLHGSYYSSAVDVVNIEQNEADKHKNVIASTYFYGFYNLEKLTIGEGYEFIGSQAFFANDSKRDNYSMWSLVGSGHFEPISHLKEVILPESLKGIGSGVFAYKDNTEFKINLPQSLEYIGAHAFRATFFMQNDINLPNLYYIGQQAFAVTGIHDLYLSDKLQYVANDAFMEAWNLNDITFDFDLFAPTPYVQGSWGNHIMDLTSFIGRVGEIHGWVRPNGATNISDTGFNIHPTDIKPYGSSGCGQKFGTVTFTEKVKTKGTINFYSFNGDKLDLGESAINTESNGPMFGGMGVKELILPETMRVIGENAFSQTYIEKPLYLPETLEIVNTAAFTHFDPNPGSEIDTGYVPAHIEIANIPKSLTVINDFAFTNATINTDVDLPNITLIGRNAFDGSSIKSINIPQAASIGQYAFVHTNNLESVVMNTNGMGGAFTNYFGNMNCVGGPTNYYYDGDYYSYISWDGTYENKLYEHNGKYYGGYEDISYHDGYYDKKIYYYDGNYYNYRSEYYPGSAVYYENNKDILKIDSNTYVYYDEDILEYDKNTNIVKYQASWERGYEDFYVFYNDDDGKYHIRDVNYDGYYYELYLNPVDQCYYDDSYHANDDSYRYKTPNAFQSNIKTLKLIGPNNFNTYNASFDTVDLSEMTFMVPNSFNGLEARQLILPENLENIYNNTFYKAKIAEPITLPSNLKLLGAEAFQWAEVTIAGDLPETLEIIDRSAFYGTDPADELTIPASVRHIGQSAFNAGDADVHYDKFTIKPNLDYEKTADQAVFQMLWNADINELVIESNTLPVLASTGSNPIAPANPNMDYYRGDEEPEFWGMTMQKVSLTNIPTITKYAFESCDNLVEVDLSANTNLAEIREYAFADDNKLAKVTFADGIEDNTVNLGLMSFAGTALKDISGPDSSFDLTAAKFNADKAVFANINTLVNVSVPNNFTNGTIPELTFFNDTELRSAELDYKIEEVKNKAFAGDDKLLRVIVWGKDTNVVDEPASTLEDIDVDLDADLLDESLLDNPTIPQTTDIYAYSVSIAEDLYAEDEAREGNFYALDEVMQLSSNNVRPMLNDDETDFDKTDVILYALRRDGVILESTELYNFSDAYKRTDQSGKGGFGADDDDDAALRAKYATMILDTPVPMDEVDLSNQNFEEVTFDIESSDLIRIYYEDWYSGAIRETTITPYSEDIDVPKTGFMNAVSTTAKIALPVCPIILVAYLIYRKKQHRE